MSCIHHAMTERFFGTSCICRTMTKLPNYRVQESPHMVFHTGYTPQKAVSYYHVVLRIHYIAYAPQKTKACYHLVL
jgi:hypothetical protein